MGCFGIVGVSVIIMLFVGIFIPTDKLLGPIVIIVTMVVCILKILHGEKDT